MQRRVGAILLFALLTAPLSNAAVAELPPIKAGRGNVVPECVTPGRLMAYLNSRNGTLDPRYDTIASEYMRAGEKLGVRWDYAFFQMILETGSLSYRRGNRSGDVRPSQNNFAGLGATGRGEHGESFQDIRSGVQAHLEHLLLYAGDHLDNPVADRTRKVQEWGVLTNWHRTFTRPITFGDLATKWAPGTSSYRRMIEAIAEHFEEFCGRADPRPELSQEVRGHQEKRGPDAKSVESKGDSSPGTELAQRAIDLGKAHNEDQRSALGAQPNNTSVPFRVLNAPAAEAIQAAAQGSASAPDAIVNGSDTGKRAGNDKISSVTTASTTKTMPKPDKPAGSADKAAFQTASAAGAAKPLPPPAPAAQKCRVWTASYGGQKAMIIKSVTDKVTNYTVLDVNQGSEAREAEAFISAYAKNGAIAGEFVSQSQALEKAFELCPEG